MSEPAAVVATTESPEAIAAAAVATTETSEAIAAAAAAAALTDVTAAAVAVTAVPVAVAATTTDPVVAAAASAPIVMNEPTKIIPAIALPVPKRDPNVPSQRDVIVSSDNHRGTMLLHDLVRLHYFLWRKEKTDAASDESKVAAKEGENAVEKKPEPTTKVEPPTDPKDVEELATHLAQLFAKGKPYELSGLKDVPTPFFKGEGFFFENVSSSEEEEPKWNRLDEDGAKGYVSSLILSLFGELCNSECNDGDDNGDAAGITELVTNIFVNSKVQKPEVETKSSPRPCDVLFLPADSTLEDNLTYEPHQSGNKHMLFLASQYVSVKTKESASRIKAALALITSKVQGSSGGGTDLVDTDPRYVIQRTVDGQNSWSEMAHNEIAEFATIFVFEIYLEKRIYEETVISPNNLDAAANVTPNSLQPTMNDLLSPSTANIPSTEPIPAPTTHDVLFGRGGMTNGHGGNRRFRDIIALHRPDYVQATKMDKPNVARKIVRAIRSGNPPGRFLRKGPDNNWRDVGDKVAAEKTSQGLRERSNAEKRQRSAQRESLRIGREGAAVTAAAVEPDSKKIKLDGAALSISADGIIPASMNVKKVTNSVKKIKKGTDEESETPTESLPANAVDKDGNVLVTDHDILCGRGGLTNHHKGNKRFRDIVALHRPDYVRAPKIQKPSVARVIVRAIRNGDPPGRFLKKDSATGKWYDIGDKKAAEKTSQALREKSDEEKGEESKIPAGFASPTLIVPTAATAAAAAATNVDAALTNADFTDAAVSAAAAATRALSNDTEQIKAEADVKEDETKGESSTAGDVVMDDPVKEEEPTHIAV